MPRQRADRERVTPLPDVRQLLEPPDVNEQRRTRDPQPQHGQQRMPACKELRVLPLAEQGQRVTHRLRDLVVERCGNHDRTSSSARQIRSGVAGIAMSTMPSAARASTTAFITAAGDAIAPVSPTPFTPSGFVGLGVSTRSSSHRGSSAADGTRYDVMLLVSRFPSSSYTASS